MVDTEEWRPVVGYEGLYEVSSEGRTRTVHHVVIRSNGIPHTTAAKLLVTRVDTCGYGESKFNRNGKQRLYRTHRVVAAAFLGSAPIGKRTVNHKNGIRTDNRAENLEYASDSEQQRHRFDTLKHRQPPGEACHFAKLSWGKAELIRAMYQSGEYSTREIGSSFGVSCFPIQNIIHGRTWKPERMIEIG